MIKKPATLEEARRLFARLERMSVDSSWARRASGLRGGMIKLIDELESNHGLAPTDQARLNLTVDHAYTILTRAAREMRGQNLPVASWTTRPLERTYWVVPDQLLAGYYPGGLTPDEAIFKLKALLSAGITYFVDLTEPGELEPYESMVRVLTPFDQQVRYVRRSIPDASIPYKKDMHWTLDLIDRAVAIGDKVYIHCWGGRGRTGTVIGCWLVRHGMTGQQALERIAKLRSVLPAYDRSHPSPETSEQINMVLHWCD